MASSEVSLVRSSTQSPISFPQSAGVWKSDAVLEALQTAAVVVSLAAGATALRFALNRQLGHTAPFLLAVAAVMIAAYYRGFYAGLATTFLCAGLVRYFLIVPVHSFGRPADLSFAAALTFFEAVGAGLSWYGGKIRRATQSLAIANERLILKHEVARLGSYEWSVQEGYAEFSPEAEEIFGVAKPGRIHTLKEWKSMVHPQDLAEVDAKFEATTRSGQPTSDQTYRIVRLDGEIRWIHSRRRYHYDANGNPVYVIGVIMDITDCKRGEAAQEILGEFLHVCSSCRRVHDVERNEWYSLEAYLQFHNHTEVSHGMCEECGRHWYSESRSSRGAKVVNS